MSQVATKLDFAETKAELKEEIIGVRTELKEEIAIVRSEIKEEISNVRTDLKEEIAVLRESMLKTTTDIIKWMVGIMFAGVGLTIAILTWVIKTSVLH